MKHDANCVGNLEPYGNTLQCDVCGFTITARGYCLGDGYDTPTVEPLASGSRCKNPGCDGFTHKECSSSGSYYWVCDTCPHEYDEPSEEPASTRTCSNDRCFGFLHQEGSGLFRCDACDYVTRSYVAPDEYNPVIVEGEDKHKDDTALVTAGELTNTLDDLQDFLDRRYCEIKNKNEVIFTSIQSTQNNMALLKADVTMLSNENHNLTKRLTQALIEVVETQNTVYNLVDLVNSLRRTVKELQDTVECMHTISSTPLSSEEETKW